MITEADHTLSAEQSEDISWITLVYPSNPLLLYRDSPVFFDLWIGKTLPLARNTNLC